MLPYTSSHTFPSQQIYVNRNMAAQKMTTQLLPGVYVLNEHRQTIIGSGKCTWKTENLKNRTVQDSEASETGRCVSSSSHLSELSERRSTRRLQHKTALWSTTAKAGAVQSRA